MGNLLTVVEVAERLRVSKATVINQIKKKEIPAFRVGNIFRIDEKKLNQKFGLTTTK